MTCNTATMETPEQTKGFIDAIAEYWSFVTAVFGAVSAFFVGLFALIRWLRWETCVTISKATFLWCRNAFMAPMLIAKIQSEMVHRHEFGQMQESIEEVRMGWIAQDALRRAHLQNSSTAMFETDKDGLWTWANDACLSEFARDLNEVQGHNWRVRIHTDDRAGVVREWQDAIGGKTDFNAYFRLRRDDGTSVMVKADALCIKDLYGNVMAYTGQISQIKQSQA